MCLVLLLHVVQGNLGEVNLGECRSWGREMELRDNKNVVRMSCLKRKNWGNKTKEIKLQNFLSNFQKFTILKRT